VVAEAEEALAALAANDADGAIDEGAGTIDEGAGAIDEGGRVAVIAATERVDALRHLLSRSAVGHALRPTGSGSMLDARLAVMSPRASKGLEFDIVVLVEPSEVARAAAGDLYVAMTRPTRALRVVASGALPAGLTE